MWFGVLGTLLVKDSSTERQVARSRLKAVLATLLINAGNVVDVAAMAHLVWNQRPPRHATVTLRSYIMHIRSALGAEIAERIVTEHGGYRILLDEAELDVSAFELAVRRGREAERAGRWERCSEEMTAALKLWRGPFLSDVQLPAVVAAERPRLDELKLRATESRIAAQLELGRHLDVLDELVTLTADPSREMFVEQLMIALHRAGRQADALSAFHTCRMYLADELGVDPGARLTRLYQRILNADPDLMPPWQRDAAAVPARSGRAFPGPPDAGRLPQQVPARQLPPLTRPCVGRAHELESVTSIAGPSVVVITGPAGGGKTALGIHAAHRMAERYPDGQLYVDLRGYSRADAPMPAETAIRILLGAFDVPDSRIPAQSDAQTSLLRSVMFGRKLLLVLDNAYSSEQVRVLIPGSPTCAVLVTSRNQLRGTVAVEGAVPVQLRPLSSQDSLRLFEQRVGADRVAAEPTDARRIVSGCGHLPLALIAASALALTDPHRTLRALADSITDIQQCLSVLDEVEDARASVREAISWSWRRLNGQAAGLLRVLAARWPGPVSLADAADLGGMAIADARHNLDLLISESLISRDSGGLFAMHGLIRAYALGLGPA